MAVFQVVDQCSTEFILSAFKSEKFKTDTTVFRLHYKLTSWLVILYSVCYMYIQLSNPISCISSKSLCADCRKVLNDFCWVHGTYSIMNSTNELGRPEMYPGFGIHSLNKKDDKVMYHQYYKWMYFYITAMIILLHVPRQTWRFMEAGRIKALASNLSWNVLVRDEEIRKHERNLVDYIFAHLGYHQRYANGFFMCEILNVMVSSSLLYMWELISNHHLSKYGWSSFKYLRDPPTSRTDQLAKVFPLMGKCVYNDYGASGSIQTHDVMCVLPLNVINERAAMFFWCYLIILVAIGIAQILVRMILICCRRLRGAILKANSILLSTDDINLIVNRCSYSDWFLINQLSLSLEPFIYKEVLRKLADELRHQFAIRSV